MTARAAGFARLIVPAANAAEAALIDDIDIYAVEHLADAVAIALGHGAKYRVRRSDASVPTQTGARYDYADVRGQLIAKRALEIAAAGGHHAVLVGPPGCGKTMLAQRLPSILPSMTLEEALDVTKIASIADERPPEGIARTRPFRAPHHTTSPVALAGGGKFPRPGEISLAQHGVLYLDEIAEFSRGALEILRQPLEDGAITIARAAGTITYPARFTLIASMNPCPCGYHGSRTHDCRCDESAIAKYLGKLSGPLLDRIDLHITLARVPFEDYTHRKSEEPSAAIRARVEAARERQTVRYAGRSIACNAALGAADLRALCPLGAPALALLQDAMKRGTISARAFDRVTRVARTIADLAASDEIGREHVAEALHYRLAERTRRPSAA
jgi:magnesium chelatase family protein